MKWREGRRSENVEDMRGRGGGGMGGGAKFGIGTLVVVAAAYFLGVDPRLIMGIMQATDTGAVQEAPNVASGQALDEGADFLRVVLADTEDTWGALFQQAGATYRPPTLRLFTGGTQSGCGAASSAVGPFYCPADERVYIDLDFFGELVRRFDAPGDSAAPGSFAQAYILAHEVGHHIQHLTGLDQQVRSAQQRASQEQQNAIQVRMELQADCFAGIWAHHAQRARQVIEAGDIEDAMGAAAAVGDDMIQKRMQGHVVPESFTHGTAVQRQQWFNNGFRSGQIEACNTFEARTL